MRLLLSSCKVLIKGRNKWQQWPIHVFDLSRGPFHGRVTWEGKEIEGEGVEQNCDAFVRRTFREFPASYG